MFQITKEFHFSAGHVLHGLKEGHQCGRPHGHNYVITICLASDKLNGVGFVQDYGELKDIKEFLDSHWDHRDLNGVFPFQNSRLNPSAENMAHFLFIKFKEKYPLLYSVSVSETPKTNATYYGK